jgi:hypothetical protein
MILPKGLFSKKDINLAENTIKFGNFIYSSELYQKKYKALGIEVNQQDEGKKKEMYGKNQLLHSYV